MFQRGANGDKRAAGLLDRYSASLVKLTEHRRVDTALQVAHREKAFADLARIDMLKARAGDPAKSEFVAHSFVAHMSHELRTPLNAIIGFSDMMRLLLKDAAISTQILGYIDDINSAGWHLLRVVNDILDLSKIEAGKLELSEEEVDFAEVSHYCARMIKGQMDEKRIIFSCDVGAALPRLVGDELKLKQILINLLANAAKFTPEGGTVTLDARAEASGAIVITVSDTGIGISAKDLPKVFTPFSQLNATVSRKYIGTGLGLPLAKALVDLHQGVLSIASLAGQGTTVTIRFPASRSVRAGAAAKRVAAALPLPGKGAGPVALPRGAQSAR
jgi:signal transduction histidine kinase